MMYRLSVYLFIFCVPFYVFGQGTEDFTIRIFGAADTEAPSTTTILSAVPISSNQIDLTWSAATDNYVVFGYVIARDGIPIATTTATLFSDTGLLASTSYSYTVRAFDTVPNYAGLSPAVTATTLAAPVIPVSGTAAAGTEATATRVEALIVTVVPGVAAANVAVTTARPARIEIRIGQTTSYELGYLVGNRFATVHNVPINDLRPNTTYFYEIVGYTPTGAQTVLRQGSFLTLDAVAPRIPANVSSFIAEGSAAGVLLSWQLPVPMPANGRVRIVRSPYGYPTFINDGLVVYEGVETQLIDTEVPSNAPAFYTAFVIDPQGLVSSGAIAYVQPALVNEGSRPDKRGPSQPSFIVPTASTTTSIPPRVEPISSDSMPQAADIIIQQSDALYTFASTTMTLASVDAFSISIPSAAVAGAFKTIIATLSDPRGSGKTFSFLLRLNVSRTAYEATIAGVMVAGKSDLMVEVYDYDSLVVARYLTVIEFIAPAAAASSTMDVLGWRLSSGLWASVLIIPLVVLALVWFIFKRRADEDEDKNGRR